MKDFFFITIPVHMQAEVMQEESASMSIFKYKTIRDQKTREWSDPVKREKMKAEQKKVEEESRKEISKLPDQEWVRSAPLPYKVKE